MSAADAHKLKRLESERSRLNADLSNLAYKKGSLERQQAAVMHKLRETDEALEKLTQTKQPVVTEHAMLRYMERVHGWSLDMICEAILTPEVLKAMKETGCCRVPVRNFIVVAKDYRIVTIETKD